MRRILARKTLSAALLLLPLSHPEAAVMGASGHELKKFELGAGGAPFSNASGGSPKLTYALSQQGWAGALQSGVFAINGGFYGGSGLGGGRAFGVVVMGPEGLPDSVRQSGSAFIGLSAAQSLSVAFNKLMLPSTLMSALRVTRIRDKDANEAEEPVDTQQSYEPDSNRFLITPSSGTWKRNNLYTVVIGTEAVDQDGFPLLEATTFQFLTLADPSVANTFVAMDDKKTRLRVAPGVLPGPGTVDINIDPIGTPQTIDPGMIRAANKKLKRNFGSLSQVLLVREFTYFDAQGEAGGIGSPPSGAILSLPVIDNDSDGIVDGSNPPARVRSAELFFLDEVSSLWVRLPDFSRETNAVSAKTTHLSVFALISPEQAPVSDAYAYPVPFSPNGPNAGTGPGQTGTGAGGITFTNLPARAVITVFNVRGERVWRGEENTGAGKLVWNVRNSGGHKVASGVYIYLLKNSSGEKKTGKLMVLR